MATKGDIYAFGREQAFARFAQRVTGPGDGLVVVVYTEPLDDAATNALQKSFSALGYGTRPCTFADVGGLDPQEAFSLVEGIDPLCLVASDAAAARLCARAVRADFPLMQPVRLFGRDARGFPSLNGQLETERDRQLVWHVLKSLPRA